MTISALLSQYGDRYLQALFETWKLTFFSFAGAFLIGIIAAMALKNQEMDPHLLLLLKVGVCGGFTTFSTFSLETVGLLESGNYLTALLYVTASVVLCVAATLLAEMLIK